MPDTKPRKPKAPDRTANLLHGGSKSDTCPRCHRVRSKTHGIPEISDSDKLRTVVGEVMAGVRQDRAATLAADAFMIGALEARIGGRDYYFVTSSGQQSIRKEHLGGISYHRGSWELVHVDPPRIPINPKQRPEMGIDEWRRRAVWEGSWKTVRGEKVDIPVMPGGRMLKNIDQPCSAIQLLLALSDRLSGQGKWGKVDYVRMSEQYYIGRDNTTASRQWHGQGNTCSWTAHSCEPCEARIPYLICDVPANAIPD
ncbi:hypothetical protein ABZ442_29605 [Streptomyces triculaminicus]|uniref:hypothetical protein n=1 Tax=Streptomyces triculaminicus TaxID=2816232 RepID=UPI0033CD8D40